MKRTTVITSGLAVTAALALSGYTVAAGQAATPHQSSARHAGGFSDPATGPVIGISNYTFHAPASVGRGVTPGKVGDYHFHCKIHGMHGTLRVR